MSVIFKCKMCGGDLDVKEGSTIAECLYCGRKQTLPKLDDDKRRNLYDRATYFRQNGDFDKAMTIYEQILSEDNTDAEAYWSLVLCRYGIEYVEDPATHQRVPTVNRTQPTPVTSDEDYKQALHYADDYQTSIYEEEAKAIDEIQKNILEISRREKTFDVFICYKESDNNGQRTPDSVLAVDLYDQLTKEGMKVFCSRITLKDKLGQKYEPYIFAALNSAPVMVVIGTKPEYFNAVWVRNEWSRYLTLIKNGAKKTLIPAYRDMDPYDLPDEFQHLQAQDMGRLGFMQDLFHGIVNILDSGVKKETYGNTVQNASPEIASLLQRAFMFLEDGDFTKADEYCDKVLDIDPENARAYLGKFMAENKIRHQKDIENLADPGSSSGDSNYYKAMHFGDEALVSEIKGYGEKIIQYGKRVTQKEIEKKQLLANTDFIYAAYHGYTENVKSMIRAGADVNMRDEEGDTALIKAVSGRDSEMVKLLLKAGADVNAKDNKGNNALMDTVGRLIYDEYNESPYPSKMERDKERDNALEIFNILIEAGINIDEKNNEGYTALIKASLMLWMGKKAGRMIINMLIKAGIDVNIQDNFGQNALMQAVRYDAEIVKTLIEAGADVHAKDFWGNTALLYAVMREEYAVRKGKVETEKIINLLLDAGADVHAKNKEGKTFIDYAWKNEKLRDTDALERLKKLSALPPRETTSTVSSPVKASGCMTIIIETVALITALVAVGCLM